MPTIPLGQMLREQLAVNERCGLRYLQDQSDKAGPRAQMELDLVTEFFRMAQAAFADAIVTGARVPAVQLGNGQNQRVYNIVDAYDWTYLSSIRDEGARYHPVWLRFAQWCEKNELTPVLTDAHNEEKGTWWLLTVKPTDASSAKTD